MKLVIGLSGRMGSGKTVVSDYLRERYGAVQLRYSKILMDILDRLHLPCDRGNLQRLGAALRDSLGGEVVANAFEKDLAAEKADIVVVDGIRYLNEVALLRKSQRNLLLFIDAPSKVRHGRCVSRGEKGEGAISFEDFMRAEGEATEKQLSDILSAADVVIENTGSLGELYKKIDEAVSSRLS